MYFVDNPDLSGLLKNCAFGKNRTKCSNLTNKVDNQDALIIKPNCKNG